ncbi:MAG: DUF2267 domain-containing protein [Actinomycetota bacterium]|nr:DUF2267 domain-containing protein [Actinomycetota bacterium]
MSAKRSWAARRAGRGKQRRCEVRYDEFVKAVQDSSGINTREHAERAVRARLEVLGQRVAGGEVKDLAAQLPAELKEAMRGSGAGESFGLGEFYRRVAQRAGQGCIEPRPASTPALP